MFQPVKIKVHEFVLEPAGDIVHSGAPVGEVIGGDHELGQDPGVPHARVHGGDHHQAFGHTQQGDGEARGLVLLVGTIGSRVPGLRQGVLEAAVL